jgi:hypothetical protein
MSKINFKKYLVRLPFLVLLSSALFVFAGCDLFEDDVAAAKSDSEAISDIEDIERDTDNSDESDISEAMPDSPPITLSEDCMNLMVEYESSPDATTGTEFMNSCFGEVLNDIPADVSADCKIAMEEQLYAMSSMHFSNPECEGGDWGPNNLPPQECMDYKTTIDEVSSNFETACGEDPVATEWMGDFGDDGHEDGSTDPGTIDPGTDNPDDINIPIDDPCMAYMPAEGDTSETAWDPYLSCLDTYTPTEPIYGEACAELAPGPDSMENEAAWLNYYTCLEAEMGAVAN